MFRPTNPKDKHLTEMQRKEWEKEQEEQRKKERQETIRFRITAGIAAVAAVAAVAGVILQFVFR